jgi:tetratricopeptide (TPR) repeat protein
MAELLPKELGHARELMDQVKLDEALEIIENFEKGEFLSPKDQLSSLLIKGEIYIHNQRVRKALQTYDTAYQMSQDLGLVSESISALIGKSYIAFAGDFDKANSYILEAERIMKSLDDTDSKKGLKRNLSIIRSWILNFIGNFNGAMESAQECLKLTEEENFGNKLDLAETYILLGWVWPWDENNVNEALNYALKSLELLKELKHNVTLASSYALIGRIYRFKGDYDKALEYCKKCLTINEITKRSELEVITTLADVYRLKSELNRALKYQTQAVTLAEELNITDQLIFNLENMGYLYRTMGRNNLALEYAERCLILSEKWSFNIQMANSLYLIIVTYIDENSREKANQYLNRLSEFNDQTKNKGDIDISYAYLGAKAYMMKTSTRMRDRVEAQALFKGLIDIAGEDFLIACMSNLCDLLLDELSMYNDPKILDEIIPLINKCLDIAESARNYGWLADTKLLQSKLALIQMDFEEAKRLMVEAQRIAELHGLNLLAWGISSEHDKILDQIDLWDRIVKDEAPIAERMKLASTKGVLERIQGKRAIIPPESVDEQSTVLLILAEGGILIFSYPFTDEWKIDEDLFSSFLSAFASFSGEFFSKGLDRVKFGDDRLLMESIGSFSFCYLFKGQTYLAKEKLLKFVEAVQNNQSIWQSLDYHYKTNQVFELKGNSPLESLITEIFIGKVSTQ